MNIKFENKKKELAEIRKEFNIKIKFLKEQLWIVEKEYSSLVAKKIEEIKPICPHEETKYVEDINYHTGEEDYYLECLLCGHEKKCKQK